MSDRLYNQQALQSVKSASTLEEAFKQFSSAMFGFEVMRTEFKCYLKDDLSDFVDKEVTQGLDGVTLEEFKKRANAFPLATKFAYKNAVDNKCSEVLKKILINAAMEKILEK